MKKYSKENLNLQEVKLGQATRVGLRELHKKLAESGHESLTIKSAISACNFLLKNF